jgi:hypothetical protein
MKKMGYPHLEIAAKENGVVRASLAALHSA